MVENPKKDDEQGCHGLEWFRYTLKNVETTSCSPSRPLDLLLNRNPTCLAGKTDRAVGLPKDLQMNMNLTWQLTLRPDNSMRLDSKLSSRKYDYILFDPSLHNRISNWNIRLHISYCLMIWDTHSHTFLSFDQYLSYIPLYPIRCYFHIVDYSLYPLVN